MLHSIALILLVGMGMGFLLKKLKLPGLLGMLLTGIILGPSFLNVIDASILNISPQLRKIALIIILTRAGLTLDVNDLKKVGRPAVLMCFLPAVFEITGILILAPLFLSVSILDAAIIGTVVAAVSPAVIVPKMIRLIEEGYGKEKGIPQLILAGASVDDIFVIVLFTVFTGFAKGEEISYLSFLNIPVSIVLGAVIGAIIGYLLTRLFNAMHMRDTEKVIIFISLSFLLVTAEDLLTTPITFASLISIMAIGIVMQKCKAQVAKRLSLKFNKLWVCAEIILFVLVGATVDINYVTKEGIEVLFLILGALCFRVAGVFVCLIKTVFTTKERLFCAIAYLPKATVQAAIGGIPLSIGLACGNTVLTVAVCSIIVTAPLGAFLIDRTYQKLLKK